MATTPSIDRLTFWTVYFNPKDHPGKWVLRAHDVMMRDAKAEPQARTECAVADTIEAIRTLIPPGLHRQNRWPDDDPVIVEVWF